MTPAMPPMIGILDATRRSIDAVRSQDPHVRKLICTRVQLRVGGLVLQAPDQQHIRYGTQERTVGNAGGRLVLCDNCVLYAAATWVSSALCPQQCIVG